MAKKSKPMPVEKLKASNKKPLPVKIISDSKPSYVEEDKKWKAKNDLETLQRAKEIEADRERMKAAKSIAKEQKAALAKIC